MSNRRCLFPQLNVLVRVDHRMRLRQSKLRSQRFRPPHTCIGPRALQGGPALWRHLHSMYCLTDGGDLDYQIHTVISGWASVMVSPLLLYRLPGLLKGPPHPTINRGDTITLAYAPVRSFPNAQTLKVQRTFDWWHISRRHHPRPSRRTWLYFVCRGLWHQRKNPDWAIIFRGYWLVGCVSLIGGEYRYLKQKTIIGCDNSRKALCPHRKQFYHDRRK